MKSNAKRIIIATFVSALGCTLSGFWYLKMDPQLKTNSESEVIAYLASTKNEIHVKALNSALWEPASEFERLREGDSIRTSAKSETRIQFYDSKRVVDIEPDSMIIIQKNKNDINLELLDGSLFVRGIEKGNKQNLSLKTKTGNIDLSSSVAQISGNSQSVLNLKVLKGTAKLSKEGAKAEIIKDGKEGTISATGVRMSDEKVRILSPDVTKPIYVNATSPDPVLIQWTGLPGDAQVFLASGSSRSELNPTNAEKLSKNQFQVTWKPGIYYWKLKALDPDTRQPMAESPTYKIEVIGRYPPTPITPEPNFVLQTRRTTENVTLRWLGSQEFKEIQIELRDEVSKKTLLNKKLSGTLDSQDAPNLPLGNYAWRLTGFPVDGSAPLQGPFYQFSINEKKLIKIQLTWNSNMEATQYYVDNEPKLSLMWDPDQSERVKKWKVRIAAEGMDPAKGEATDTRQIKLVKKVPKNGRYQAYIEAFDDEGENIGTSEIRTFNVAPLPLLAAPILLPRGDAEYFARPDGSLNISWEPISGARDYQILVRDRDGKIISELSTENSSSYKLTNLMPGNYSVQIGATDTYGRRGDLTGKRMLIVPDMSEVKAPKLRKIKVN